MKGKIWGADLDLLRLITQFHNFLLQARVCVQEGEERKKESEKANTRKVKRSSFLVLGMWLDFLSKLDKNFFLIWKKEVLNKLVKHFSVKKYLENFMKIPRKT